MSVVLRFVDESSLVREELLGFVVCDEGLKGDAIVKKILRVVEDLGLNKGHCGDQGHDGAANMSGKCSGAATIFNTSTKCALSTPFVKSCHCICMLYPKGSKDDEPCEISKSFIWLESMMRER